MEKGLSLANLWIAVNKNRIKEKERKIIQEAFNAGFKAGFNEGKNNINTSEPHLPLGGVMSSANYVIGCDPYDKLNWWQKILKKIGYYKNRPKVGVAIFKKNADGTTEFVKHCS